MMQSIGFGIQATLGEAPRAPTLAETQAREVERLIAHAYTAYDTDRRAHGPEGYAAFHDAVQRHVTQFLQAQEVAYLQAHIDALHAACEAVDQHLAPEATEDETIRCYVMPAGVWHQVLGLCRGRHT
jgi:hypothetical protein